LEAGAIPINIFYEFYSLGPHNWVASKQLFSSFPEVNCSVVFVKSINVFGFVYQQEVDFFTNSLNQLKMAQNKYVESQESLGKICPQSKDKEILVPLTSSVSFYLQQNTQFLRCHYTDH